MATKDIQELLAGRRTLTPNPSPKGRGEESSSPKGRGEEASPKGRGGESSSPKVRGEEASPKGGGEKSFSPMGRGEGRLGAEADAEEPAETHIVDVILAEIEGIEVEAVVGGCLQRLRFRAGTDPASIGPSLKALDPGCKLRDDFPARGAFGKHDSKLARAVFVSARITASGKFVDLGCQNGDDFKVSVTKKNADEFVNMVAALGKVSEKNITKLRKAYLEQGEAMVMLTEPEQFGVRYWTSDDGRAFVDGLEATAPLVEVKQ